MIDVKHVTFFVLARGLTIMWCPVYDITNMTSFEHAAKWLDELVSSVNDEILVVRYGYIVFGSHMPICQLLFHSSNFNVNSL